MQQEGITICVILLVAVILKVPVNIAKYILIITLPLLIDTLKRSTSVIMQLLQVH
jgi:hypothetical protein